MSRNFPRSIAVVASGAAVLATAALSGCVREPPSSHAEPWTRNGEMVNTNIIWTYDGPGHCEWQDARFLELSWPIYSAPDGQPKAAQYVRDPDGVLGREPLSAAFRTGVTLPDDAEPTGYERDGMALWLAESDRESTAYLVTESPYSVEAWPRADPASGCD